MKTEPTIYNFQFISFKLLEINFEVNYEFLNQAEKKTQVEISTDITSGFNIIETHICQVILGIQLKKGNAPFFFSIKGQADFDFQKDITGEKEIEKIVHINLLAIVYPFLREPIADLTRRMGFTPLLLAPVNFVEMFKEITASKEESKPA